MPTRAPSRKRAVAHAGSIRIAEGEHGDALLPTEVEAVRAGSVAELEPNRAPRKSNELERSGRTAAEEEVARLRMIVAR